MIGQGPTPKEELDRLRPEAERLYLTDALFRIRVHTAARVLLAMHGDSNHAPNQLWKDCIEKAMMVLAVDLNRVEL